MNLIGVRKKKNGLELVNPMRVLIDAELDMSRQTIYMHSWIPQGIAKGDSCVISSKDVLFATDVEEDIAKIKGEQWILETKQQGNMESLANISFALKKTFAELGERHLPFIEKSILKIRPKKKWLNIMTGLRKLIVLRLTLPSLKSP